VPLEEWAFFVITWKRARIMMDFDLEFPDLFAAGRRGLRNAARAFVQEHCPEYFDLLEKGGDSEAYFEPMLHANREESETTLFPHEQFLFGYVPPPLRPSSVTVRADDNGTVYVPRIGFFTTSRRLADQELELRHDSSSGRYALRLDQSPVSYRFSLPDMIEGTPIQVYPCKHPLFRRYFDHVPLELGKQTPQYDVTRVEEPTRRFRNDLEDGLKLIRRVDAVLYDSILASCRMVVLLDNPNVNSMAASSFLGAVFLSTLPENDPIFFAEDLLHQGGHNTFSAVTSNPFEHYTIPEHTEIREFTTLKADKRSLEDAVHGIYTLARMAIFFDKCLDEEVFIGKQKHELLGRFALCMQRYQMGLEPLGDERLYKQPGLDVFRRLERVFERIHAKRPTLAAYDLSNQAYVFRYERFRKLNPITEDAAIS
jgi:HEXXH motif-containing protein